jgi:hypothetical protein
MFSALALWCRKPTGNRPVRGAKDERIPVDRVAPPRRTLAFHALMWTLTALACLGVAGLYFVYRGRSLPVIPMRVTGDWLIEGDEEIGFVPARNGATEMHHLARVDAPGAETPERVDVMAIGCSFTWGTGVESEATYPRQLERMLGVPVANFGMGSYGSVQAFQTLLRNADLKPKVVVYGFIQDHLRRNLSPCAPNFVPYCLPVSYLERENDFLVLHPPHMEYFSPTDNQAFLAEVSMRDPNEPFAWLRRAEWAAKIALFRYRNSDTIAVETSPAIAGAGIRVMIDAMLEETQKIGARLVVLNMPYLPRGNTRPVPPALAAAVADKDLTFVDFTPVALDYYERHAAGTLTLPTDPHPSPETHRLIAETLASVIRPLTSP